MCILMMKVFQQMAVKCLVPFPNLHKVLFGLARVGASDRAHVTGQEFDGQMKKQVGSEKVNSNSMLKD